MKALFGILLFTIATTTSMLSNPLQTALSGRVTDAKTGNGVMFVNIGVLNKGIGTVSDENGNYSLQLNLSAANDTVKFSCIGYDDFIITVANLNAQAGLVKLSPKPTILNTVVIKPKFVKKLELGVNSTTDQVTGGFMSNDLGSELATLLPYNKKKPAHLKKVFISISESGYDSVFFRLNVYKVKKGFPGDNMLQQPIYIKSAIKNGVIAVDLSAYDISFTEPVAVSIEWLKDLGQGQLYFSCKLFKGQSFARKTSQAAWEKIPVGVGIWANVDYEYK